MIDHVQQFTGSHLPEIGLFVTVFVVGVVMRMYGRYLERRTREHSAEQVAQPKTL